MYIYIRGISHVQAHLYVLGSENGSLLSSQNLIRMAIQSTVKFDHVTYVKAHASLGFIP